MLAMNSLPARTSATARGAFIADAPAVPHRPAAAARRRPQPRQARRRQPGPKTLRAEARAPPRQPGLRRLPRHHRPAGPRARALRHPRPLPRHRPGPRRSTPAASSTACPSLDGAELATRAARPPGGRRAAWSASSTPTPRVACPCTPSWRPSPSLEDALASAGNRFDRLLLALVTHDEFRFATPGGHDRRARRRRHAMSRHSLPRRTFLRGCSPAAPRSRCRCRAWAACSTATAPPTPTAPASSRAS